MKERRRDTRVAGPLVRRLSALVRPGQWVVVIDLSPSGALVAGRRPLRPGGGVDVYFHAEGHRAAVRATVVRCAVAAMDADRVIYHAGLSFEQRAEWVRERRTPDGSILPDASLMPVAEPVHPLPLHSICTETLASEEAQ